MEQNKNKAGTIESVRRQESLAALHSLGIPEANAHFLDLPERSVARQTAAYTAWLAGLIEKIKPAMMVVPFRFDQHPDHLAINRIARGLVAKSNAAIPWVEYFVYFHYPLLPKKDIRSYCHATALRAVRPEVDAKRRALDVFVSQNTNYFHGQSRPVLSRELMDERSCQPEYFFVPDGATSNGLAISTLLVACAQYLQPRLKRIKETLRPRAKAGADA